MGLSIIVAKIFSVIYISSGLALFMGNLNFSEITDDLAKSPAMTFIAGAAGTIAGMVLLQFHNTWTNDWTVVVTLVSWVMFLGGLTVVIFPKSLTYAGKFYKNSRLWGLFMVALGIVFGYFGFLK